MEIGCNCKKTKLTEGVNSDETYADNDGMRCDVEKKNEVFANDSPWRSARLHAVLDDRWMIQRASPRLLLQRLSELGALQLDFEKFELGVVALLDLVALLAQMQRLFDVRLLPLVCASWCR